MKKAEKMALWIAGAALVVTVLIFLFGPAFQRRTAAPALKLVEAVQSRTEPNTVEFKLKNSGDDAALLKAIRIGFSDVMPNFFIPRPIPTSSEGDLMRAPLFVTTYTVTASVQDHRLVLRSAGARQGKAVGEEGWVLPIAVEVPSKGTAGVNVQFTLPEAMNPHEMSIKVQDGNYVYDAWPNGPAAVTLYIYSMWMRAAIEYDEHGVLSEQSVHLVLDSPALQRAVAAGSLPAGHFTCYPQ